MIDKSLTKSKLIIATESTTSKDTNNGIKTERDISIVAGIISGTFSNPT